MEFTIVITTFNRSRLLIRALESIKKQEYDNLEVIVIDDASTDDTERVMRGMDNIRYIRQPFNQGPQAARNLGLHEARNPWVIIMDDDDELLDFSIIKIEELIENFKDNRKYPVLQFKSTNGSLPKPFLLVKPDHYLNGIIKGDFTPIIQRDLFLSSGFQYPVIQQIRKIGLEHFLWWEVADKYGIPTWNIEVMKVNNDAPVRLTSHKYSIQNSIQFAIMQEMTIHFMERKEWDILFPNYFSLKLIGASTYWLISGEKKKFLYYLKRVKSRRYLVYKFFLLILSYFPLPIIRWIFIRYREKKQKNNS